MHRVLLIAIFAGLAGCAELPNSLGDCPDGSEITWADAGPVFEAHCTDCHASTRTGTDRNDAPIGTDYDTPEAAGGAAFLTWAQIETGVMPKEGSIDRADAMILWEWLSCGAPP